MSHKTNSFERFWKELKRRKVVNVITVYAAIAFVILQLTNMVVRPLKLPDWTEAFVIFLLCIGFVIAVFLSWIYDITPAGVKKTKPAFEIRHIDHTSHKVSSGWKIATYISGTVIILLLAFNFISRRNLNTDILKLEKSIAVLPFRNDSPDSTNAFFIDGLMEEVLNNLMKISDFRVLSRTSTEQYKGINRPTVTEIAKKLGVSYIIEGSGQKYGNKFRLRVQLIKAKGKEAHLWVNSYEKELIETTDFFGIQSQIAQTIVLELKATMTPEEKQLIGKVPTYDTAAYVLYLRAKDYQKEYMNTRDLSSYQNAVAFYKTALMIDPSFAKAYTGLAIAYANRYYWPDYFKQEFIDSCLILLNKALSIDDQLDEAYYYKAMYYYQTGRIEEALDNCDKATKVNPNYYSAYALKGQISALIKQDYVYGLENGHKALNLIQGKERPNALRNIGLGYLFAGFPDKAKYYFQEALTLDGDSVNYFDNLYQIGLNLGNTEEALTWKGKAIKIGSTYNSDDLVQLSISGRDQEALMLAEECVEDFKKSGALALWHSHRIGYAFWKVGKHKESEYYFDQQIKYCIESIKLDRQIARTREAHYNLAGVYAFKGDKGNAYKYLDEFNTMNFYPLWWINLIKHDPLFDSIRNEERFQMIIQNMEAKYQAEHERVKEWLEEQRML